MNYYAVYLLDTGKIDRCFTMGAPSLDVIPFDASTEGIIESKSIITLNDTVNLTTGEIEDK